MLLSPPKPAAETFFKVNRLSSILVLLDEGRNLSGLMNKKGVRQ